MLQGTRSQRGFRQFTTVAIATGVCGVLAACSSGTQEVAPDSASASAAVSREAALYRDSQICVVNDSPNIITVAFSQKQNSTGEGVMQPNAGTDGQACATGGSTGFDDDVVAGVTTIKPNSNFNLSVRNPSLAKPRTFGFDDPSHNCMAILGANVGDSRTWDNGILKYTVTREADSSDLIRWSLNVTGTVDPALDGIARSCG